jgi:endonuclease/exonuclease/phosphatase family metal-dependent hydrolase
MGLRILCGLFLPAVAVLPAQDYIREQIPPLLAYDELRRIGETEPVPPELQKKVDLLLTTPFVNNEAWHRGVRPRRPDLPRLGPSIRLSMWNVERGLNLDLLKLLFTDKDAFIKKSDARNFEQLQDLADQIAYFSATDIFILNELDWGMKRTEYREVVRELADALGMNWAYGVEFLEIDPVNLGTEPFEDTEVAESAKLQEMLSVDKERFRGLHGSAVLSRYPIRSARLEPFLTIGYDWYKAEKDSVSKLEKGKRKAAERVFLETILREVRRGGRTALTVTIDVPDLVEKQLTIVNAHLENRCKPEFRRRQLTELLERIKDIRHPVVLAGDLNTSLSDAQPVTVKREIYKRVGSASFWAERGLKWATGIGLAYDLVAGGLNKVKNLNDPTARHIPVVARNPEAALFDVAEEFRFADGGAFDFRGSEERSGGRAGTLANSNERGDKGFVTTYEVTRTVGPFGQFKLDWIFVKPYGGRAPDVSAPYRFSPHFPHTLKDLNYSYADRLSDHNPMVVDLPLTEPSLRP